MLRVIRCQENVCTAKLRAGGAHATLKNKYEQLLSNRWRISR